MLRSRGRACTPRSIAARISAAEANPHLHFDWARELAEHPAVVKAAEAVLGDCEILSTQLLFKPPRSRAFVSWHQDSAWRDYAPGDVCSAWIALTDTAADNGCMQVVRGSAVPAIIGVVVPRMFGEAQVWQEPVQAVMQQTPSTQKLDLH